MVDIRHGAIHVIGGTIFDFINPETSTFDINDVAHSLARLCRFTGHVTFESYTVGQHSLEASYLVPPNLALATLLHDATEFVINDLSSPLKELLLDYRRLEAIVEREVMRRFGIPIELFQPHMHPLIKHADLVMLATERRDVCPQSDVRWACLDGIEPRAARIREMRPNEVKAQFLCRYFELKGTYIFNSLERGITQENQNVLERERSW